MSSDCRYATGHFSVVGQGFDPGLFQTGDFLRVMDQRAKSIYFAVVFDSGLFDQVDGALNARAKTMNIGENDANAGWAGTGNIRGFSQTM